MKNYCFILAGSEDRSRLLKRCMECIENNSLYKDSKVYLYWQGDSEKIPYKDRFTDIIVSDTLMGVFTPRYELFKQFGIQYEYTILIDDDLFLYPDTSYESAIAFLKTVNDTGVCNIGRHFNKKQDVIKRINYGADTYNVEGGMVYPNRCVRLIVEYFKDTPSDVTEDIFWILLYVKGFDLYRDFSSKALHTCHRPSDNGSKSGYYKLRLEKPHKPLLPEYVEERLVEDYFNGGMRYDIPAPKDVNEVGLHERCFCRRTMGLQ